MKKNPILVVTGLAVAAAAGIAGLTRDQWMPRSPEVAVASAQQEAAEPAAPAAEQPAAVAEQPQPKPEEPAAPAADASAPAPDSIPPAPVAAEAPSVEVPAATAPAPAVEASAAVSEAPAPAATAPAPAVATPAPVAEAPEPAATPAPLAEAPAPAVESPPGAVEAPAPAVETPPPAAEAPAPAVETPSPVVEAPAPEMEVPAPAAAAPAPAVETPPPADAAPSVTIVAKQEPAAPEAVVEAPEPQPEPQQAAVTPAPEAPAAPAPEAPANVDAPAIPAFDTVRVEKTGEAIIAGTAQAGAEVTIMLDGKSIGTTLANSDGAFVVVPDKPLPSGSGALTIEAKAEGASEAEISEQVVAVIVPDQPKKEALVAIVSPNQPTKVLQKPQSEPAPDQQANSTPAGGDAGSGPAGAPKPVSLDAVDYDTAGNIVFTGRGEPGHSARIYVDNSHSGDARVGDDGRWAFAGNTGIAAGVHALRVDGIDGSGKVVNRVEVPFFREETNKVAAAAPIEPEAKTDQEQLPVASSPQVKSVDGRVVIQPGNNLWRISKVLYGSGAKYTLLYEANKDLIRDPDMIYPGQVFLTPDAVAPQGTIDPALRQSLDDTVDGTNGE